MSVVRIDRGIYQRAPKEGHRSQPGEGGAGREGLLEEVSFGNRCLQRDKVQVDFVKVRW